MADPNQTLVDSAAAPKQFQADNQNYTEHELTQQLAVTKFQMATQARGFGGMCGITRGRLRAPGAVYPVEHRG